MKRKLNLPSTPKNQKIKKTNENPVRNYIMVKPPFRFLFIARSQTGKTTLLIKFIHFFWIKAFNQIHIFCPTYGEDNKWSSLDKYVKSGKIKVYPKVDEEIIKRIWDNCKKRKIDGKNLHDLIIFDDCTGQVGFKSNQETNIINSLVCKGNHANLSVCASVQKLTLASTILRSQCEGIVTFSQTKESQMKPFYSEFGVGNYKQFKTLLVNTTRQPYHYMYINQQGPGIPDYYHNDKFILINGIT